ncbi:unnamed protein product [Linum trigynum]|uniref:Uncharacterized protein n=1 Tax=Linum trigynum TaxID=586398 RepID=A0AAV2E7U3_9ROSI
MRLGERIGKPMRVDHATLSGARSNYARVCVQVDLTRPLLSQFTIHGKKYFIQYEGLDKICLQCGTYFERIRCSCMGRNEEMEVEEPAATPTRTEPKQPDTVYGEWMIAKKKPRSRRPTSEPERGSQEKRRVQVQERERQNGSRFNVLEVEEIGGEGGASTEIRPMHSAEERDKNKGKSNEREKEKEVVNLTNCEQSKSNTKVDPPVDQPPSDPQYSSPRPSPIAQTVTNHVSTISPPSQGSNAMWMELGQGDMGKLSKGIGGNKQEKPPDPRVPNIPRGDIPTRMDGQQGKVLSDGNGKVGEGLNEEATSL